MSENDFKKKLSPEQYHIMRERGTEKPFTGKFWNEHGGGMYRCAACDSKLFSSDAKFDSGTGWPSFSEPADLKNVEFREDLSYGMKRIEVLCKKCGSHLGHVFEDLPPGRQAVLGKNARRYCINSCALKLEKNKRSIEQNK